MRIVIDMQGAQTTGSRSRGIGRYTLSLVQAIARNRGEHDVVLALNGLFPDTINSIRSTFKGVLPRENVRVWHSPGPCHYLDTKNSWRRQAAELVREAFLAKLDPSIVLVTSLFEGAGDDGVTSVGCFSPALPTAAILYDLIPLIHRRLYLNNLSVEEWYENKLGHIRRAELLLAISESTRLEGIRHLGFPPEQIINISTAADRKFTVQEIDTITESNLRKRYGLKHDYVMYTGGIDYRKNIEGLIRAYSSLPSELRQRHQLVIVCAIQQYDRDRLTSLAKKWGLAQDEMILTGHVPEDDLIRLYNLCKCFVFPSWHEGFGLPALEAMACGRAVIGSNRSSIPEVIGWTDALFDPFDDAAITEKLVKVLTDASFREDLERHGSEQAKQFSWHTSAQRAISALEELHAYQKTVSRQSCRPMSRPRLAYISPLPPERSGIADYSAELLPELSRHYKIDVVIAQETVSSAWIRANCPIRTVDWFRNHADEFDRVLYHFGNSVYHQHMFDLLETIPGIVVLHDFFLSSIISYIEHHSIKPSYWDKALYKSHGYVAVHQRHHAADPEEIVWTYPCNLAVLQHAQGIIVHSEHSRRLVRHWYGEQAGNDWIHIPLLRVPTQDDDQSRVHARKALGLGDDDFIVCSFGLLNPPKLNHRLLDAWLASPLAADKNCLLIFVGENDSGAYGNKIHQQIKEARHGNRIRITGWTDHEVFRQYLIAADVGVQLRTQSRGETSAAVLDCMNHGLATVINANGSMADIPHDCAVKLEDNFSEIELAQALCTLRTNPNYRKALGITAKKHILTQHAPRACADQYFSAIENFYRSSSQSLRNLIFSIAQLESDSVENNIRLAISNCIDCSISTPLYQPQILVDISELIKRDAGTGIQRVVGNILQEWLFNPPSGYRIEPVYATSSNIGYLYANKFTLNFLNCSNHFLRDDPITYCAGDIFIGLDFQPDIISLQRNFYQQMRRQGVIVKFVVYDLLIIYLSNFFVGDFKKIFEKWLQVIAEADGAVCISKSTANDLSIWMQDHELHHNDNFEINWFHLGADIRIFRSNHRLPEDAEVFLKHIELHTTFLMVGTIEPRKGHAQVLGAFEQLWRAGVKANLVIIGKQGWLVEKLTERIRNHPELERHLFWLEGISDEYLVKVYAASTCLIAASYGEGFGLPLIEAARHQIPIIVRDIPVFREVAGEHAFYFEAVTAEDLSQALSEWLELYDRDAHPKSHGIQWLTWKESAKQLAEILLSKEYTSQGGNIGF